MFERKHRASTSAVNTALQFGKTQQTEHFSMRHAKNTDTKVAAVVSKKVQKTAVARNKLKRRMRAAVNPTTLKPGTYIVYAKKGAQNLSSKELQKEVTSLLD